MTLHGNVVAVETIGHDGEVLDKDYVGVAEGQPFLRVIERARVHQVRKRVGSLESVSTSR